MIVKNNKKQIELFRELYFKNKSNNIISYYQINDIGSEENQIEENQIIDKSQYNKHMKCESCNFETIVNGQWVKHLKSKKHIRDGKPKETKCNFCEYEAAEHWILKRHYLTQHATTEERAKCKLYCGNCDQVFFTKYFYDLHMESKVHKNNVASLN